MSQAISTATEPEPIAGPTWVRYVPVPVFASVMGLTAVGLCWRAAAQAFGVPAIIGEAILLAGAVDFLLAVALYGAKLLRHPDAVVADACHPVRGGFLGQISICVLLLAKAAGPFSTTLALALVVVGVTYNLLLTLFLFARWITTEHVPEQITPTWLIPAIASLLVPFVGLAPHHPEAAWFFFTTGLSGWLLLLPLVLGRLFHRAPLPPKLRPTIYMLIAPPAIAFLSYSALVGAVDAFARILYYFALSSTLTMLAMAFWFARLPFAISWWAFTMPSGAVILATFQYSALTHNGILPALAAAALLAVSVIVIFVGYWTVVAAATGRLFVPE